LTRLFHRQNVLFLFFTGLFIWLLTIAIWKGRYEWMIVPFAALFLYISWPHKNTIFLLLIASLPFSIEFHFSSSLGTDIPDEFLMVWVTGLFLVWWNYHPGAITKKEWQHPLLLCLWLGTLWTLIATVFSSDIRVSVKLLLAKIWYIGAFILAPLIFFRDKEKIGKTFRAFAISMSFVVIIVLIRHSFYDFRFADVNRSLSPFFRNHVNYSAMLVCSIPVLLALYKYSNTFNEKAVTIFAIAVSLLALFFSYSRGAWLALPAGLLARWLIKQRWMVTAYVLLVLIVAGSFIWLKSNDHYLKYTHDFRTTIYHKNFKEHIVATYKLKDVSTAERFYRWIAGVRMIKEHPLTGFGPNTFNENYKPYAVPAFKTWVSDNKEHSTVHNYFLLLSIEQGIPALMIFVLLLGLIFWYAQHLYHRAQDKLYKTIAWTSGVITAMIMVVIFLSDLIETDKIGSLFFLCLSMLVVTDLGEHRTQNREQGTKNKEHGSETDLNFSADIQRIS